MRILFVFIFSVLAVAKITCQVNKIVSMTKVNWADHPDLYKEGSTNEFIDKYHFLENVDVSEFTYMSDGLKIEAFAAIPKNAKNLPVIIFNRGGNRDFGALSLRRAQRKYSVTYNFSKLANEGYIVIGCNYRGCGKSEGEDQFGGNDVNDVLNLIEAVQEIPEADTSRIGMYGWSRGGMMTYLTLPLTNKIKVAVVGGAPTDKTIIDRPGMETNVYSQLIPNYWENKETELKKRSAVYFAETLPTNVPILMLHGNADWRVKSTQSLRLALEFEKYRIPYRLKIFEGAGHSISQFRDEKDEEVVNWFNRYLKNSEPLPDMDITR